MLGGGCVPLGEEGLPFAPVIEALRGLADDLDADELQAVAGPARQELARLVPDLAWGGETAAGPAVASRAGQGRLFELLLGVVGRLAATAPLLWVMEDLHWADRSTRELLAYLATYLRSGPVLLVGSFRSDELHRLHPLRRLLAELTRNRRVVRLELERFSRAELTEQLAGLLGTDPPARLVEDVYARSEGNPFFAEELLLAGEGGGPGTLPPSLREVLLTRVVRLGLRTQQLLRVAAAAGPGATQPLLAAVADIDDQQLLEGLREAVDQQLLVPDPAGGEGYVFRHALLAEAVYAELLAGERVRLHTALAGALEAGLEAGDAPASRAARLAYHWAAAGDQPRALTASLAAAAAAEGVYAFAEAQLQLERVLKLWERVPDAEARAGRDRVALLSRCAEAAYGAGDPAGAAELVRQALGLVDAARQPRRAGLLHEQLARCLRRLGDPAALGAQQQAVRLVPPEPSPERARVLGSLALYLVMVDRFAEARGPAEEAIAIAGRGRRRRRGGQCPHRAGRRSHLPRRAGRRAGRTGGGGSARHRGRRHDRHVAGDPQPLGQVAGGRPAGRKRPRSPWTASSRPAASAWPACTGRCWPATPPRRCWPWAAGTRPSSSPARAWRPPHRIRVRPSALARAALELGLGDLDAAQARLQAVRRLLPAPISEAQHAGPLFARLAELAVWRGDLDQARKLVAQAVPQVAANPRHAAPIYALGLRVEADRAELARARHPGQPTSDDHTATALLAGSAGPPPARPPLASRSWPPGRPPLWPSGPASGAPPTRPRGRPRRGMGAAGPALPGRLRLLPPGRGAAGRR